MTTLTAVFASSVLTLSIGLYFGVILALCGLLVLAGTAGQWNLARTWCPALFEHSGTVFVLIGITLHMHDLAVLGFTCIALSRLQAGQDAASLNQKVESVLLTSALMSVGALSRIYAHLMSLDNFAFLLDREQAAAGQDSAG